jgi:hypothetical protein
MGGADYHESKNADRGDAVLLDGSLPEARREK